MKHDQRRKAAAVLGLILCLILLTAGFAAKIGSQQKQIPENPVTGVNQERSQVLYRGEGYYTPVVSSDEDTIEEQPETEVLMQEDPTPTPSQAPKEEQKEEIQEPQEEPVPEKPVQENLNEENSQEQPEDPGTQTSEHGNGEKPSASEDDKNGEEKPVTKIFDDTQVIEEDHAEAGDDDYNQEEAEVPQNTPTPTPEVEDLRPSISSDLQDGEVIHRESRVFSVYAEDYKERALTPSQLTVLCNGQHLTSISTDNGVIKYKAYLDDVNTISITAQDRYGNQDTVSVTVYKEITGDEEEEQPAGTITFSLEASTMGLGYLIGPAEVPFYEEETLPYVLNRVLYSSGFQYHYTGSMDAGFYLKSVDRPGITLGYQIPAEILQHLEDVNDIPDPETCSPDWLGDGTLTGGAGWMFSVNGTYLSSGMNTYFPADGDEIRVRFTLYYGADIGEAMLGGETWGDW